jgi:hypothetical protein
MTSIGSWRFWVIIGLALTTLACAGRAERRERREEAREERRERAEQRRTQRAERTDQRRSERSSERGDEPKVAQTQPSGQESPSAASSSTTTTALTPVSTAPTAATAESTMVFMRATNFGGAIAASVFDVTDSGAPKFVGIINRGNKLSYRMKPGLNTFMVVSEAADFLQVTAVGGKTYYALVTPRMGVWKARFSFKPVRGDEVDGRQFAAWDRGTRLVTNTPRTLAWARDNAADVADKRDRYWPEWNSKGQSEKDAQSLRAEDGR